MGFIKNLLKNFSYLNQDIYDELQTIKKMLILKEINPQALSAFVPQNEIDFSPNGLLNKATPFINLEKYNDVKNAFLKEAIELKISELYNTKKLDNAVNIVTDFFNMLDRLSAKYIDKKYEYIDKMYQQIADPCCIEALNIFFEHVNKKYTRISKIFTIEHISYLLYKNDYEQADKLLKAYVKKFGTKRLYILAPVANFAYKKGYRNKKINIASKIFEQFEKGVNENLFEKYIKNKNVAIIGNGPQELNTGNGKKIDSYDDVVRCNSFDLDEDEKHKVDYGKKTTVWIKGTYDSKNFLKEINVHITRCNLYIMPLNDKIFEYPKYIDGNRIFTWIPDNIYTEIKEKYNIYVPTTGFLVLYWIKKINEQITRDNCYGFSFKDNNPSLPYHYFDTSSEGGHMYQREREVLNQLL